MGTAHPHSAPNAKPFIPPIDEYQLKVADIMNRGWLTNQGPCVLELEEKLKNLFNVDYLILVTNGTIALQMALKALKIQLLIAQILNRY